VLIGTATEMAAAPSRHHCRRGYRADRGQPGAESGCHWRRDERGD